MLRSPWDKLLEMPGPQGHMVQLYDENEQALARNVGEYFREGLKRGEGLLLIAAKDHREAFLQQLEDLGVDPQAAMQKHGLVALDAHQTLNRFMVDGQPDWVRFETVMGAAIDEVRPQTDSAGGFRAYGEMVGILWKAGQYSAAGRLEQFWNKLLGRSSFSLFCSYPIDVFGREFQAAALDAVLSAHTHLLPAGIQGNLDRALDRAMDEILGPEANQIRSLIQASYRPSWAVMPRGEAIIFWLRTNLPGRADEILTRAREHGQIRTAFQ